MYVIFARNVNDAYTQGLHYVLNHGVRKSSRAGTVLSVPYPVATVYTNPKERVLFNPQRDANPFFHLFESLWMLAGRNDARWLDRFVKDFSSRFAEDGGRQHGAYGFRWRHHFDVDGGGNPNLPDQLDTIVEMLKKDPTSRQAVLTMWDPIADLNQKKRDLPCNCQVFFRIRDVIREERPWNAPGETKFVLDITVTCRSNDVVWGCLSGNTLIMSPEGDLPIASLARRFDLGLRRFPVYAVDPFTGNMNLKWCTKAWKTGVKPVIRLVFDDGTDLKLTTDHILYLKKMRRGQIKDGKFNTPENSMIPIPAGSLKIGDRIWASRLFDSHGYAKFKKNVFHNTAFSNMQTVHLVYDELMYGKMPEGFEVHHKDIIKRNNQSSNLERLTKSDHMSLHMRDKMSRMSPEEKSILAKKGSDAAKKAEANLTPEEATDLKHRRTQHLPESKRVYWEGIPQEERSSRLKVASDAAAKVNTKEELQERGKKGLDSRWRDPEQHKRQSELMKRLNDERRLRANHKIVEIVEFPPEEVYDFTVEDYHTALVGNGVLAHNCYGANAVHFSFLQEYMAARIGVNVGTYTQFSNDFHLYESIKHKVTPVYETPNPYEAGLETTPVITDPDNFDRDLQRFMTWTESEDVEQCFPWEYANSWFSHTAEPLFVANSVWKGGDKIHALEIAGDPAFNMAPDWRRAAIEWMHRRSK